MTILYNITQMGRKHQAMIDELAKRGYTPDFIASGVPGFHCKNCEYSKFFISRDRNAIYIYWGDYKEIPNNHEDIIIGYRRTQSFRDIDATVTFLEDHEMIEFEVPTKGVQTD